MFAGFRKETLPIYRAVTYDNPTGVASPTNPNKPTLPKKENPPEKGTLERHLLENPGDVGLLTLKGKDWLSRADVIIYDHLVNRNMMRFFYRVRFTSLIIIIIYIICFSSPSDSKY